MDEPNLPATTTLQQDLTREGQRKVNLIWEATQAIIAVVVTAAIVYTAINTISSPELTNAFFLIIGFYYSRTNHANIGGVGEKPEPPYEGR